MKLQLRTNKDGTSVWCCEWWPVIDGKRRHTSRVLGPASGPGKLSRSAALKLLSALSTEIDSAREASPSGLTTFTKLSAAASMWFNAKQDDWARNTRAMYRFQLERVILPALGEMAINEIRHRHVQALYAALARRNMARATISQVRAILGALLRWLKRQDLDLRDVQADLPRRLEGRKETKILTGEQIAAVMAEPAWFGVAARTMLLCGLRPGEALALRHCDVSADRMTISRSVIPGGLIGPTKTRKTRVVPVPPVLAGELAARPGGREDLLFAAGDGGPYSRPYLRKLIYRAFGVTPRQLRTTFATLVAPGDLVAVQRMLGHAGPEVTARHYVQGSDERNARRVRDLEKRMRRKAG